VKPTVGLASRSGITPISHTQDTAGPLARSVRDAALLLGALAGEDPDDPATAAGRGRVHADYARFLDPAGLTGARIGVARNYFGFNPGVDSLMEEAIAALAAGGAEIVDPAEVPNTDKYGDAEYEVLLYEFKADLEAYLAARAAPLRTLAELVEFNERNRDREMPFFGQEIFLAADKKGPLTDAAYTEALATCRKYSRAEGLDAVLGKHRLDAVVAPTGGPAWTTDLLNGDHFTGGSSSAAAVAGYPSVSVPAGFLGGLPVGISFIGAAWSEPVLLKLAFAFEQATRHRRAPRFLPTAELGV
jgi:amidase